VILRCERRIVKGRASGRRLLDTPRGSGATTAIPRWRRWCSRTRRRSRRIGAPRVQRRVGRLEPAAPCRLPGWRTGGRVV